MRSKYRLIPAALLPDPRVPCRKTPARANRRRASQNRWVTRKRGTTEFAEKNHVYPPIGLPQSRYRPGCPTPPTAFKRTQTRIDPRRRRNPLNAACAPVGAAICVRPTLQILHRSSRHAVPASNFISSFKNNHIIIIMGLLYNVHHHADSSAGGVACATATIIMFSPSRAQANMRPSAPAVDLRKINHRRRLAGGAIRQK